MRPRPSKAAAIAELRDHYTVSDHCPNMYPGGHLDQVTAIAKRGSERKKAGVEDCEYCEDCSMAAV